MRTKAIHSREWIAKVCVLIICIGSMIMFEKNMAFKSYAYTQTTGKVTTASAKVRTEANTTSSPIGSVKSGDTITIIDEVKGADGNVWYQVTLNSQKGYIRSDLAEKASGDSAAAVTADTPKTQVTATDKKSGNVLKDSVRVRKEATTGSDVVATVGRGVALTVEGEASGADGKKWYSVSFNYNNKTVTGFVRSDFITFDDLPEEEPETAEISGNTDGDTAVAEGDAEDNTEAATEPTTEPEVPEQTEQTQEEEQQPQTAQYQLLNVEEVPEVPAGYTQIQLKWNGEEIRSWKNGDFYIFYAQAADGKEGWYRFDSVEGTYQRYDAATETAKGGLGDSTQTIIMIVLAVVIVILLIILTILFLKLKDYKDDDQWDEEDDDMPEDEDSQKERAKKTWRALNFLTSDDYDDDEDDDEYDDDDDEEYEEDVLPVKTAKRPTQQGARPTGTPARRPSGEQTPVRRPTGERAPVRRPTGEQAPVRRPQGEQTPVRRPSGEQAPVRRPLGEQTPVRRPSGEQTPVRRPSGEQAPVRRPSGEQAPVRRPTGEQAPVRRPSGEQASVRRPTGEGTAPARRPLQQGTKSQRNDE